MGTMFWPRPKSGFWPKNGSYPKKSPKMTFSPLIIWAKGLFFFEQLFPVVARTWLGEKSGTSFLGPKFQFLAKKSDFCHTTPILVDDPFLALGMTVNFPPWKQFFDFPFRTGSVVLLGHFFDGPDDSTEFRRNRTKIKGSCPSNASMAKNGQKQG